MKEQQINQALQAWWKSATEVTTLDFKNYLRAQFPAEDWTQQYVSRFLFQQGMDFYVKTNKHGDPYRVYTQPMILTSDVLLDQIDILESVGEPITKTKLKTMIRGLGYPVNNFKVVFDSLGLNHNNCYTSDNHKIWIKKDASQHFSKSKQRIIEIGSMAKPYLKNAISKSNDKVRDIIQADNRSELYNLLEAYFTFDLRKKLKDLA